MSTTTGIADATLSAYAAQLGCRESSALAALREETAQLAESRMQISPLQGAFMQMVLRILGCTHHLEIGVFTGYSTLAVAESLPSSGQIVALDISKPWTDIARRHWAEANQDGKIDLRLAPALESLEALCQTHSGAFDSAFVDADKENLEAYFEACLTLVRPGGLILIDNVLWGGSVVDVANQNDSTLAIRAFNEARHTDSRVDLSLVPIGDGVTLLRVRE